tara:strand:+ start:2216 stop:2848 length:633 start_codon:yes stop_codon:yes gene_type:complete
MQALDHNTLVNGQEVSILTHVSLAGKQPPKDATVEIHASGRVTVSADNITMDLRPTFVVYARNTAPQVVAPVAKVKTKKSKTPETEAYRAVARVQSAFKNMLTVLKFGPDDLDAWASLGFEGDLKPWVEQHMGVAHMLKGAIEKQGRRHVAPAPEPAPEPAPATARDRLANPDATAERVARRARGLEIDAPMVDHTPAPATRRNGPALEI